MQPRLDTKRIAAEIVSLIVSRQNDSRVKWNPSGSVRVLIGQMFPSDSAVKQTLADRRRRFRIEIERQLAIHGWRKVGSNVYAHTTS
jgi:hypothetical protein